MTIPRQPAFGLGEFRRRWEAIRRAMETTGVDVLATFSPHNVFYLTGMDSENLFDYQCAILDLEQEGPQPGDIRVRAGPGRELGGGGRHPIVRAVR